MAVICLSFASLRSLRLNILLCYSIAVVAAAVVFAFYVPFDSEADLAYFKPWRYSYVCGEGQVIRVFASYHKQRIVLQLKSGRTILAESREPCFPVINEGTLVKFNGLLLPLGDEAAYYHRWKVSQMLRLQKLHVLKTPSPITTGSEVVRLKIKKRIDRLYQLSSRGLVAGMFLGNSAYLSARDKELLRSVGLSHLTAASGFNISIVAALASMAVYIMGGSRRIGAYLAIVLCSLYLFLVGWAASLVRAFFMASLALMALPIGRPIYFERTLCIVWMFMLISDPAWIEDVGFQLSFGAILGIVLWMPVLVSAFSWLPKVVNQSVSLTISVNIFLLPLLITYFEKFPSAFLPANLLIAPALELVFVLTMPTLILADFPYLGELCLTISEWLCRYALKMASILSSFFPVLNATSLSSTQLMLSYTVLILGQILLCNVSYHIKTESQSVNEAKFNTIS
ncbi:MAG: ComEC/Rec2 family competence protein [Candidatus Bruticola sp.]